MVNRKKFVLSCVGKDFNWGIWSGESRPRCVRGKRSHEVCSLLSVISSSVVRARQWESSSGWGRKFERNRWGEIIFQIIELNGGNGIHNDELRDPNLFRRVFFPCELLSCLVKFEWRVMMVFVARQQRDRREWHWIDNLSTRAVGRTAPTTATNLVGWIRTAIYIEEKRCQCVVFTHVFRWKRISEKEGRCWGVFSIVWRIEHCGDHCALEEKNVHYHLALEEDDGCSETFWAKLKIQCDVRGVIVAKVGMVKKISQICCCDGFFCRQFLDSFIVGQVRRGDWWQLV